MPGLVFLFVLRTNGWAQKIFPERSLYKEILRKGNNCFNKADFACASDYYFRVLRQAEKINDSLYIAIASTNLAAVFQETDHLKEAKAFANKAIALLQKMDQPEYLGNAYNVLGNVHYSSYEDSLAFYYYRKALKEWEKAGDSLGLLTGYKNLGAVLTEAGQPDIGLPLMEECIRYLRPGDDSINWFSTYMTLGEAFVYNDRLEKGLAYLNKAAEYLPSEKGFNKLYSYHYALYYYHKKKRNFSEALKQHELYKQYSDSVFSADKSRLLQEMNTRYETDKKEARIRFQEEQIRQERKIRSLLALSLSTIILLLAALFIISRQRLQRKTERLLQKQHEKNLQDIFMAEQNERIRIARDLHDSIGQKLAVMKMLLTDKASGQSREKISTYLDETAGEVRSISHNLMPEILRLGLAKAVENLAFQVGATQSLRVDFKVGEQAKSLSLTKETELTLYRIVQEILANILRHARTDYLALEIDSDGQRLQILIEDKGVGFDPGKIQESEGLGWKNIASRIRLVGGTFALHSERHKGSRFVIAVPLANDNHGSA